MSSWKPFGIALAFGLAASAASPSLAGAQEPGASAEESGGGAAAVEAQPAESLNKALIALATALTIMVAVVAGALSQAKAAVAAIEGIARNPGARKDVFVPFVLALALIESLVLYALIIAFILSAKVG
ncbi:MAG: ATP synthase F0 subunit C [Myxococcota bacterium]|nr:ATP synthase F0 subunit C [Myxococcota bacterium]